jgi:hypothetical protein
MIARDAGVSTFRLPYNLILKRPGLHQRQHQQPVANSPKHYEEQAINFDKQRTQLKQATEERSNKSN